MISLKQVEKRLNKLKSPADILILFDKDGVLVDKFGERYSNPPTENRQIIIIDRALKHDPILTN